MYTGAAIRYIAFDRRKQGAIRTEGRKTPCSNGSSYGKEFGFVQDSFGAARAGLSGTLSQNWSCLRSTESTIWPASPVHYQDNSVKTIKTSVMGTIIMLGLANRVKSRILEASTSDVYGEPNVHSQNESYCGNVNPIGICSCYDEGKRVAETLIMDYYRQNKVDMRIFRIFPTYGPRIAKNDGRVVSNFILQALRNEDISVFGDSSQIRSLCYVSDLIEGMIRMMGCDNFIGPVKLVNPIENTILEFAKKTISFTGSKSQVINQPSATGRPETTSAKYCISQSETWMASLS